MKKNLKENPGHSISIHHPGVSCETVKLAREQRARCRKKARRSKP